MARRRCKKHFKGRKGEQFRQKVKGLKPGEVVGVAIDVSKSFPRVMIFNFPYYQNLARHLVADGEEVIFMSLSQAASNREQTMMRGLKTDDKGRSGRALREFSFA